MRGFDEREANGDEGLLLINELRTPNYDLTSLLNLPFRAGQVQLLGFWDYGVVRNRNKGDDTVLSGIGAGGRYRFGAMFRCGSIMAGSTLERIMTSVLTHWAMLAGDWLLNFYLGRTEGE